MAPPITRRLFLAAPAILHAATRSVEPACVLFGEQTEGPYYIDKRMVRRDITEGKPGVPLTLRITVLDANRCLPLHNASVDLWHCDSLGVYSGYNSVKMGPPPGGFPPPPGGGPTDFLPRRRGDFRPPHHQADNKKTFLRGVQKTDEKGVAEFATIYPGWYVGRAVHIHLKVWIDGHQCHTGQLFFPEDITDSIADFKPYRTHDEPRTRTRVDNVFTSQAGPECIVQLQQISKHSLADGLVATTALGVNPLARYS